MEKKKEVSPLDEDVNADEFDCLLRFSGTKPSVLATTQAAKDVKLSKAAILNLQCLYTQK